jgi:hypothetical protein
MIQDVAARTSAAAMFHVSVVGAVSLMVTVVPNVAVCCVSFWTQKVYPGVGSTHWLIIDWPGPSVRAVAWV